MRMLRGHDLTYMHGTVRKTDRDAGKIECPKEEFFQAYKSDGFFPMGHESAIPVLRGKTIVLPPRLHVMHLESVHLEEIYGVPDIIQFAARKDIF